MCNKSLLFSLFIIFIMTMCYNVGWMLGGQLTLREASSHPAPRRNSMDHYLRRMKHKMERLLLREQKKRNKLPGTLDNSQINKIENVKNEKWLHELDQQKEQQKTLKGKVKTTTTTTTTTSTTTITKSSKLKPPIIDIGEYKQFKLPEEPAPVPTSAFLNATTITTEEDLFETTDSIIEEDYTEIPEAENMTEFGPEV